MRVSLLIPVADPHDGSGTGVVLEWDSELRQYGLPLLDLPMSALYVGEGDDPSDHDQRVYSEALDTRHVLATLLPKK